MVGEGQGPLQQQLCSSRNRGGKTQLVEGDNCSLGSHCRTRLSTSSTLAAAGIKTFHNPPEGKGKTQDVGLFCCEKHLAAQGKSLPGTPGSFGL